MAPKRIHIFLVSLLVFLITNCKKEYSYEGGVNPIISDSVINVIQQPYICQSCIGADDCIEGKWSFYNGGVFYCGIIDTAIATPARNGFTFFGPSCSPDSGLVMTINIEPTILNQDVFYSTTIKVGMYYYDNVGQTYPFMTRSGFNFTLTIDSYIHQTRVMTGNFSGFVFRRSGQQTSLSGKFKLKIP